MRDKKIGRILTALHLETGLDFSGYRRDTFQRRLWRRMQLSGCRDLDDYLAFLKDNPGECRLLASCLTIKVSTFFRDPLVFETIRELVLPELIAWKRSQGSSSLRTWCAGCAKGEEAYSLAMLFRSLRRELDGIHVDILATDIDEEALTLARAGVYPVEAVEMVRKKDLDGCFEESDGIYRIRDEIREMVTFARHDLTSLDGHGPPVGIFRDYDLILCRNVLIYLIDVLQRGVLHNLASILNCPGYLVLGKTERFDPSILEGIKEVYHRVNVFRRYL